MILLSLIFSLLAANRSSLEGITSGRFLHVTDFHLDPYYVEGSSSTSFCHYYGSQDGRTAGKFGDRKCDTPIKLARRMMAYIRDHQSNFDFIILTGDLARHDTDPDSIPKTRAEIAAAHLMVRSALHKYFPTKPIVFAIGNNDLIVHDQLGEGPGNADLKTFFLAWRHFVPRDQWETFATGGYYRITGYYYPLDMIVLNSMYFYKANNLVDDCSVEGSAGWKQLRWLKEQLKSCRSRGAFAYLIGHVAPGKKQFYPGCFKKFVKLTRKYSDVIHTQLYGHSNYDEFFVDEWDTDIDPTDERKKKKKKHTFGLIAPSMVPLLNPAYRMVQYDIRPEHFGRLLDYDQYYVDLDEANLFGRIRVQHEYSAQGAYGPGPLTAKFYRRLQERLGVEGKLQELYEQYRVVSCMECLEDDHKDHKNSCKALWS